MIYDAFELYPIFDISGNRIELKFSDEKPDPSWEKCVDDGSLDKIAQARSISEVSDGVRAYTGIIMALYASWYRIILFDEPDAYLHPPLARKLGFEMARLAHKRKGNLIASTHSAHFLTGCIQSGTPLNVVRLDYRKGISKPRMVDADTLRQIIRYPIMRSSNVISGLFYDGVIVTEADSDRVVYDEILFRVSETEKTPFILVVNASGNASVKDIVGPLRQFGVPTAAIVDIDTVNFGGQAWTDFLKAAQVPTGLHTSLGISRSQVLDYLKESGDKWKDEGIDALSNDELETAKNFFEQMKKYGIFFVEKGQLESWLRHLEPTGKKNNFVHSLFEKLGTDPDKEGYVRPEDGDVWDFMREIIRWIADPERNGVE